MYLRFAHFVHENGPSGFATSYPRSFIRSSTTSGKYRSEETILGTRLGALLFIHLNMTVTLYRLNEACYTYGENYCTIEAFAQATHASINQTSTLKSACFKSDSWYLNCHRWRLSPEDYGSVSCLDDIFYAHFKMADTYRESLGTIRARILL